MKAKFANRCGGIKPILHLSGCNAALYNLSQGTSTICYEHNKATHVSRTCSAHCPEIYHQLLQGSISSFVQCSQSCSGSAMLACPVVDDQGVLVICG